MKTILITFQILILFTISATSQDLYTTQRAGISFFSTTPVENIEAISKKAVSAINLKSKQVYFKVAITSFEFPAKLMQEHFNENYMESDKYPMAEFNGFIMDQIDLKIAGTYPVMVEGTLNMHGVIQPYKIPAVIINIEDRIQSNCKFKIKLTNHKIEVPTIVFAKIAEEIEVIVEAEYKSAAIAEKK